MTREEAIAIIRQYECCNEHIEACEMAIEALEQEPVKHGEWKYYHYKDINNVYVGVCECTVCKHREYSEHKYCPNCGADMRGEK